jgi:serine/threonine-protein kinase RsbW
MLMSSSEVLWFPGTRSGFEGAAATLRGLLDIRRLDGALRYKVELAFEEIVTNIIRHGSPTENVEVAVAFDEREIVLTFADDGVPFDPCEQPVPTPPGSLDDAVVGGLGLVLVSKIAARMTYARTPQRRNHLTLAIPTVG